MNSSRKKGGGGGGGGGGEERKDKRKERKKRPEILMECHPNILHTFTGTCNVVNTRRKLKVRQVPATRAANNNQPNLTYSID